MPWPPLPVESENPWFAKRKAWDEYTQNDLETRLAEATLAPRFAGSVQFSVNGAPVSAIGATAFNTVKINASPTVNIGGGTYSTSTGFYRVPSDGLYWCIGQMRILDSSTPRQVGIAIGTANADGDHVMWTAQPQGYMRDTKQYTRLARFNTNDDLRLYIYSDGQSYTGGGLFTVIKLAA